MSLISELDDIDLSELFQQEVNLHSRSTGRVELSGTGEGLASMRRALGMAGARYSLTSLWKVPDGATRDLMVVFYEKLWSAGLDPRRALWEAKRALREARDTNGAKLYGSRDWAGWVLYGPLPE